MNEELMRVGAIILHEVDEAAKTNVKYQLGAPVPGDDQGSKIIRMYSAGADGAVVFVEQGENKPCIKMELPALTIKAIISLGSKQQMMFEINEMEEALAGGGDEEEEPEEIQPPQAPGAPPANFLSPNGSS
jgi:hypothetical protein